MADIEARNPQYGPFGNHPTIQPTISTSITSTTSAISTTDPPSTQPSAAATTSESVPAEASTTRTHSTLSGSQTTSTSSSAAFNALSGSSTTPSDFASTSNALSSTSPTNSAQGSQGTGSSAIPLGQSYNGGSGSGISSGAIAAAAIVPIVIIGLLFAFFFVVRRRRRQTGSGSPAMKERSTVRDNVNGTATPFVLPFVTSITNNAYYTGLDGSSERDYSGEFYAPGHSDSSSFAEPPPPYKAKTHDPSGGPIQASAIGAIPTVRLPSGMPHDPPSPDSWATAHDAAFLDTGSAFTRSTSRAGTERSINSDAYSDNASVHSAQAARMSVGGANIVSQANLSQADLNPFDDPESAASSVNGDENQSLHDSIPDHRGVSPVSYR